ncbi:TPA: phage tail protein [Citrobacter freundii]|uniref:phage tail-collar fiber domain-containing protein n=1 Tax=Citrobacter freundii TaxID=546 RepID=UPI001AD09770|nr:phage tail protein [Citrobacter freundii]HAZ4830279.1 phage tail protein [Citrobacter freundii]HBB4488114.1 phage tail protein [Citrobacter freundii]HBB4767713.1 phage tail protein [Citrobacter freundii]HCD8985053.1 phage tail protein [Citrobacter freundii]
MSQTAITLAFEHWKAQQGATGEPVLLDEFVFANVPGLNPDTPVDRNEALPPVEQIVHRQPVTRTGVVNENGVVYSAVLGADVGDFSFNWIGLLNNASGTLAMIVHAPLQQKLKTAEGQQGNVLTRSFLMEYNGAQTETGINTPAETWQIDFTARMAGMDERQRLENTDIYGAAAFFGDGWLVGKTGNQFFVTKGTGYVAGLRTSLAANQNITVTTKPVKVWLDVCWTGSLTSVWNAQCKITVAENLADYVQNGVQHYVFAVASIDVNGNITDIRPKGTLNEQQASDALKKHEQSRNHPDATTNEKGFTRLSSATDSTSEELAATSKAVKIAMDNANARLAKERNGADIPNPPLFVQNIGLQETVNKADGALQKDQNGADVPQPDWFVRNIGAARAFNGGINIGGGGEWWTPDLISWLENQGAFNHPYWMCKGAWSYANNRVITDTGCGNIQLAGAVIEVMGHRGAMTIRVTTATAGAGTLGTQFTYTNHGDDYSPGWRRDFNTTNKPTSEDVGALPITGGTVSGNLGATGIVQAGNSKKFSLSSANTAAKNADFNLWGSAERPVVIEMRDESGWHFYSQRNTDGSITLSINGQVTPSNYGNFDARYQPKDNYATQAWVLQNFVQNIRQSGVAYIDAEKNSGQRLVPAGGVLIGSQVNGEWDNNEGFYYTWIQQNINGNWLTIGRV